VAAIPLAGVRGEPCGAVRTAPQGGLRPFLIHCDNIRRCKCGDRNYDIWRDQLYLHVEEQGTALWLCNIVAF